MCEAPSGSLEGLVSIATREDFVGSVTNEEVRRQATSIGMAIRNARRSRQPNATVQRETAEFSACYGKGGAGARSALQPRGDSKIGRPEAAKPAVLETDRRRSTEVEAACLC
jgi:hypothetical protein